MLLRSLHSLGYVATCLLLLAPALAARAGGHRQWLQIEAVKRGILDYLGLQQPPAVGASVSREEEERMYRLFLVNASGGGGGGGGGGGAGLPATALTTLHVIPVLAEGAGDGGAATTDLDQRLTFCFFNSSDIYPGLRIVRAELKLFQHLLVNQSLRRPGSVSGRRASVYEILEPTSPGGEPSYRLLDTKSLDSGPVAAVTFDVRPLVERWVGSGRQQVQVRLQLHPPHPDRPPLRLGADRLRLEIETRVRRRRGRRAASSGEDCRRRQRSCCRKSLRVSFKEIGWSDWIRAPESYNMYNCGGACPANYKPANMHAMIKSAMHQLSGGTSPALCCIPAAFEPMTLLHYSSEGTLTLTAFEGMIVTNCHCS